MAPGVDIEAMLRLAVATQAVTYDRLRDIVRQHDIEVVPLQVSERVTHLTGEAVPWSEDTADVGYVFPPRLMEGAVLACATDIPWLNGREAVLTSRNKAEVLVRLERAGIPVPKTTMVSNPIDQAALVEVWERFDPPVVVKPNSSTRGLGITKVHDLDSLLGVADYLDLIHEYPATRDRSYLIQEYLPGATDYRAMVLDGTVVGAVERRKLDGGWTHNVHRGAVATGVDLPEPCRSVAERAAAELGIRFVGIDLLATDDRTLVTETNARPTIDETTKYHPDFETRLADAIHGLRGG